MRKTDACAIVARRLNLPIGRVTQLVQRASEAGLLPVARGSDRPDLCSLELARLFLASVADRGLGNAVATVSEFEALTTANGVSLGDVLEAVFRGDTDPPGDCAFQLEPAAAMLTIGNTKLFFGAALQAGVARVTHIAASTMRAIVHEFSGHSPEESNRLTYQTTNEELSALRQRQSRLTGQLAEIEKNLAPGSSAREDVRIKLRESGTAIRDELASIDRRLPELEQTVAQLTATRKAEVLKRVPAAKDALSKLSDALDAVAEEQREVEKHRNALREAGLGFKQLPQLTLHGAKILVQRALVEIEQAQ